jgi:hypothetical protein
VEAVTSGGDGSGMLPRGALMADGQLSAAAVASMRVPSFPQWPGRLLARCAHIVAGLTRLAAGDIFRRAGGGYYAGGCRCLCEGSERGWGGWGAGRRVLRVQSSEFIRACLAHGPRRHGHGPRRAPIPGWWSVRGGKGGGRRDGSPVSCGVVCGVAAR